MRLVSSQVASLLTLFQACQAFVPRQTFGGVAFPRMQSPTSLKMADLDIVTYLRTEWISAAICTNQIPRAADVVLQLGVQDGRLVNFVPRTVREIITSSAESDGVLSISVRRQLKQQQERRRAATITYVDQRADDLKETKDESVDIVLSLQAVSRMKENGLDWKRSVREAARVLKPGGRLIFVEDTDIEGESYLEYVENLTTMTDQEVPEDSENRILIFDDVGFDEVDMVLKPHIAGVAIKSMDAGMTPAERARQQAKEEEERLAELSIEAYERGLKKRRKKKKKDTQEEKVTAKSS